MDPININPLHQRLINIGMQRTPLQFGTFKKIGENVGGAIDAVLEKIGVGAKINYKSDEAFGLVAYIGKEQQLHIRGYVDGGIDSEIEPLMQHYEHLISAPQYQLFQGLWYSAHECVEYLLNEWGIPSRIEFNDKGSRYQDDQWRHFSKPADFLRNLKPSVRKPVRNEIQRIKRSPFDCFLKEALRLSGFVSHRSCRK